VEAEAAPEAPPAPPAPSIDDPSTWLVAESHDLGFRVRMPPYDDSLPLDGYESLTVYSRAEGMRGPWFLIAVAPTGVPARMLRNDRGVERVLRDHIRRFVGRDPLGETAYLGGGPLTTMYGHQAYAETDLINGFDGSMQGTVWTRAVLVGERIYVLQVREHGGRPTTEVRDAFFNSFELTAPPPADATP
ncbi:MAG: hypothetical protein K8H88_04030, partial [Sandaracinaceae bacterium]|nr:hypothetical protein [Sandaracinaceae bacterium]